MENVANLPTDSLEQVLKTIPPGVYYGFAAVGKDPTVYKVAASVGWNPHFNDVKKKTMVRKRKNWICESFLSLTDFVFCFQEVHIIHNFEKDFYGEELRVAILGYIRAESAFSSLGQCFSFAFLRSFSHSFFLFSEQLIQTIKNDIAFAIKKLDESECAAVKEDKFFRTFD